MFTHLLNRTQKSTSLNEKHHQTESTTSSEAAPSQQCEKGVKGLI